MEEKKKFYRGVARFFTGTLFSRVTGLLRDMAMAYSFGTAFSTSAFFAAFRLSQAPRRILGEGGMQTAFIPHYEELRKESEEKANQFFIDLATFVSLIIGGLITLFAAAYLLLSPYLSEGGKEVALLTLFMAPGLLFICLYGLSSALLEVHGSFFRPSIAPIAFNGVWILAALLLGSQEIGVAISLLAGAIGLACLAQWLIVLPKTIKIISPKRLFLDASLHSPYLKKWLGPLFLANFGVVAQQINGALDPLFALWASDQGPAILWYALRIEQAPLALIGVALGTALLPSLSSAVQKKDDQKFYSLLTSALKRGLGVITLCTFLIVILAPWMVKLLFERGDFTQESTHGVTVALWGYSLGLIPTAAILLMAPAFYAMKEYKIPALASLLSVGVNLMLNSLFVFGFGMGAVSVAIATSLAALFNALFLGFYLKNTVQNKLHSFSPPL